MTRTLQATALILVGSFAGWASTGGAPPADAAPAPAVQAFYTVHAHFPGGSQGPMSVDSDPWANPTAAAQAAEGLERLASTLASRNVKGLFHLTSEMAEAVCAVAGRPELVKRLVADGHDVGAHGHDPDEILEAQAALARRCSLAVTSGSGILTPQVFGIGAGGGGRGGAARGPSGGRPSAARTRSPSTGTDAASQVAAAAGRLQQAGIQVVTMNVTPLQTRPSRLFDACGGTLGESNQNWQARGALPYPWRPEPLKGDVCGHHAQASLTFLDHTSGEWMRIGRSNQTVDTVGDAEFDRLRSHLSSALSGATGPTQTWGFVSHLHEYMDGGRTIGPMSAPALAALVRFLDDAAATGGTRLSWGTATELAARQR